LLLGPRGGLFHGIAEIATKTALVHG
jgi:hypothetical protein